MYWLRVVNQPVIIRVKLVSVGEKEITPEVQVGSTPFSAPMWRWLSGVLRALTLGISALDWADGNLQSCFDDWSMIRFRLFAADRRCSLTGYLIDSPLC
jgi:hypothetical protein